MDVTDWLGVDNTLGIEIWNKKYRHGDETFDQWLERVSGGDADIKNLILKKKFLFAGRILSNRGIGDNSTTSNCFVDTTGDSLAEIYDTAKRMALTYKAGGGVGVDISCLAPAGAKVNNPAKTSSGAISFIELFTTTTGLVGQNGRRGALMCSLSCDHPDIEEFIKLKTDVNKATTANLSIRVSDDFMNAVKNDEDWFCSFTRKETGECISKALKAKDLFKLFCDANYDYGEPGLLYWDRIRYYNMLNTYYPDFQYAGVNPCFTGDMRLKIVEGGIVQDVPLRDLEGRTDIAVVNNYGHISYGNKVWCSGEKEIVRVNLYNGKSITCTPNHVFMTSDGSECMAKDLAGKRLARLIVPASVSDFDSEFVKLGFIQGDGQTGRLSSPTHKGIEVNIGKKDGDVLRLFEDDIYTTYKIKSCIYLEGYKDRMIELGFSPEPLPTRVMPVTYESWTDVQKKSFLRGMFSANGSVVSKYRVQYKTTCHTLAIQIMNALQEFGIHTNLTVNKPKSVAFANGTYMCKESYDVCINQAESIFKFTHEIGFIHEYKQEALLELIVLKGDLVSSVKPAGIANVYDFTEKENHWGIVENVIVHNCSEACLPDGGACLLGSMNLAEYINSRGRFDIESFGNDVAVAISALNKVQEEGIPNLPLPKQRESAEKWRQVGLGIMGLGDMLIKMNIEYGSEESIRVCDVIGEMMATSAIRESELIGEKEGSFPAFDPDKTNNSSFVKSHMVRVKAMRNAQLLAIAPCGTIATMIGVTGGIEPLFALEYTRTTKSLNNKEEVFTVIPEVVKTARADNKLKGLVCAQDLDYRKRIAMQAIWQKHIDSSISSTINLPEDFPKEGIYDVYMSAWKMGLKGITVFRDGCKRAGILNTKKDTPKAVIKDEATADSIGLKRTLMTGCGTLHCLAFFDKETGDLLSLYDAKGSTGGCQNFMVGLSRMVSLSARAGCPLEDIVDQLKSCGSCPSYAVRRATKGDTSIGSCCPVAIGNALIEMHNEVMKNLGKYPDEKHEVEKKEIRNPCPQCGDELQFSNGCTFCKSCGFSRCS